MKRKYISMILCAAMALGPLGSAVSAEEAPEIPYETELESEVSETEEDVEVEVSVPVEILYAEEPTASTNEVEEAIPVDEVDFSEPTETTVEATPTASNSEEDAEAEAQAAAQAFEDAVAALPDPANVTMNDAEQIAQVESMYENLSSRALAYVTRNSVRKLMDCEDRIVQIGDDMAAGRELSRRIKALPEPNEITLDDEDDVADVEAIRDSSTEDQLSYADPADLEKLLSCRDALTGLKAQQKIDEYLEDVIEPLIDSGEYDEAGQRQIDEIIQNLRDRINDLATNGNPDGSPVTQAQLDALIQQAKDAIAAVKTVHQLAAEAYEAKIKAFKTPSQLKVTDKAAVEQLLAEYDALDAKAKQIVDTEYLQSGETYKSRLDSLRMTIQRLVGELAEAKKNAKDYVHHSAKILPDYRAASGINEPYDGIDATIRSGNYDDAAMTELTNIRNAADSKIDDENLTDVAVVNRYRDEAITAAKKVKDKQRKQADAYEAKIDAMGPVIDLSRNKADDVAALRREYDALPSYAKKYVDTNRTSAGDTYKERLVALEARIDRMAQDDADKITSMINSLPALDSITTGDEGRIKEVRSAYDSMTKEAKAKVSSSTLKKLADAENRLAIEKKKVEIQNALRNYADKKKSKTSYYPDQSKQVNDALDAGIAAIGRTKTVADAQRAYDDAVRKIDSVQTKVERLRAQGTKKNFRQMKFRSTKQTKTELYFRWSAVDGVTGYRLYGGVKGGPLKMLKQYDYTARSGKISGLKKKTNYQFVLFAFVDVDGQIIHTHESQVAYVTTKGGKYGNAKSVKISKVGKKKIKKNKVTLKVGKTAKIKAKEKLSGKKLRRFQKIAYESSNPKVATVSASGKIKAVGKGTCTIYAFSQTGTYKSFKVVVK